MVTWPNTEFWLVSFVVLQGIRTSFAKKIIIFVIFQGGGGGGRTPAPPLDPHMYYSYLFPPFFLYCQRKS